MSKEIATAAAPEDEPKKPKAAKAALALPPDGSTLAEYRKAIANADKIIDGYEKSGFVTRAYWVEGRALDEILARHLWPKGMSFAKWCKSEGIRDDRRSRAKGISDYYASADEAAAVPLPEAQKAYEKMRADEKAEKNGGAPANPPSDAGKLKKRLDALKQQFSAIRAEAEKLSDDALEPIGEAILQFAAEVAMLAQRVHIPEGDDPDWVAKMLTHAEHA